MPKVQGNYIGDELIGNVNDVEYRYKSYRLACTKFVAVIDVDSNGTVIFAAPIVAKFIGQHVDRLVNWVDKQFTGLAITELKTVS